MRKCTSMKTSVVSGPRMMTVREIAGTGLMPEHALRRLLKEGRLPAIFIGKKALINYDRLCSQLQELDSTYPATVKAECYKLERQ